MKKIFLPALVLALFSSSLWAQQASPSRSPAPGGQAASSNPYQFLGGTAAPAGGASGAPVAAPSSGAGYQGNLNAPSGFWYLYGAVGKPTTDVSWIGGTNPNTGAANGYKLIVGYFPKNGNQSNFGEGLSYEGGLVSYGQATVDAGGTNTGNNAKVLSKVFSAVWNMKDQKWTLRAGAGLALNTLSDGASPSVQENNMALRWHVGAAYKVADSIHIVGEYETTKAKSDSNPDIKPGDITLTMMSLGVRVDWQ
jgi:hypothetical protein